MKDYFLIIILILLPLLAFPQDKFPIYSIEIEGNKITKDAIILRELTFNKNDEFDVISLLEKIEQSKQNLKNLKLFNFSNITFLIKKPKGYKIKITVIEQWYIWPFPILEISERNLNVWWEEFKESNYSDFSRLNYGVLLSWKNFRGRNESLSLKIRRGFKEQYLIEYKKPYIDKNKTFGFSNKIQLFQRRKTFYKTENNTLIYLEDSEEYTTKDLEIQSVLSYRKGTQEKHALAISYFKTIAHDSIVLNNPDYLGNSNKIGDYYKLNYEYYNENRNYSEYPTAGYYFHISISKFIPKKSPVKHLEITGKLEKYLEPFEEIYFGSSFKAKWSSEEVQPYFAGTRLGFKDFVRGYEHYVIDGQKYWISKTAIRHPLLNKIEFEIPYVKINQFRKSHLAIYLSVFSDLGYIIDSQKMHANPLSKMLLWGKGISLDFITYYDKIIRLEYSIREDKINKEKGIFLHFSSPL